MGFKDLRDWLNKLEAEGELHRIKAKVDWNLEITEILRTVFGTRGPALLFENIKDYERGWCTKLFSGGLASRKRVALMLGMPKDTPSAELVQVVRKRFKESVEPVEVATGPVKENIIKAKDVDLFELPLPKWHLLDGGRYINTWCGVVTTDPDTGEYNVGMYRGMIVDKNRIAVLLIPAADWGKHYEKYQRRGASMPVAVVYGWDPSLGFVAGSPALGDEYKIMGAIRQQPVDLVKCETSELRVPASAEIVVEGSISPDPSTYETEGPFGEWTGYYSGMPRKRPVIRVDCITHRDGAIFRGSVEGMRAGLVNESAYITSFGWQAVLWNTLESQAIPGILDIVAAPLTTIKIHKTYQGQARQIAAALWGSKLAVNTLKTVLVVEEDVDIHNLRELQLAIQANVDPARDIIVFPMDMGSSLDTSLPHEFQNELVWGAGRQNKFLIDATVDWATHPVRPEWGNRRLPPKCTESPPEIAERVRKRWKEYGFSQ